MVHRLRWRQLVPGLIALAAILAVGTYVVATGSVTAVHGKTMRIHVALSSARGITKGSEVRLAGTPVGLVTGVDFAPASADTSTRLVLTVDIHDEFAHQLRSDADVEIASGSSFIGAPVLAIGAGTPEGRILGPGDTLHGSPGVNTEELASRATLAARQLPPILGDLRIIATDLQGAQGTLGALMGQRGGSQAAELQQRVSELSGAVSSGTGTVGLALSSRSGIGPRVQRALARVDSVRALLASDRVSYGRFRRDSTLLRNVGELRDELSILQFRLTSPDGTVGRLSADSAVVRGVADAQHQMQLLFADVSRHPFRYVRP